MALTNLLFWSAAARRRFAVSAWAIYKRCLVHLPSRARFWNSAQLKTNLPESLLSLRLHDERRQITFQAQTRAERYAADRTPPHRALFRRAFELAENAKRAPARRLAGVRLLPFRRRLARAHHALCGQLAGRHQHSRSGHRLARRRPRPAESHAVHPVRRAGARRTASAALDDYSALLARTRPHV